MSKRYYPLYLTEYEFGLIIQAIKDHTLTDEERVVFDSIDTMYKGIQEHVQRDTHSQTGQEER